LERLFQPRILPKHSIWDSIHISKNKYGVDDSDMLSRSWLFSFFCEHILSLEYTRTDHRPGPGWMTDTYEGLCCKMCGKILKEKQIY
jgi:hypothetical protein